ncbi:unnamed protein product [Choristocarpus tenellus]
MDFSSPRAALRSLKRRTSIPEEMVNVADNLQSIIIENESPCGDTTKIEEGVMLLLNTTEWEGVAVGFLLAKVLVDNNVDGLQTNFLSSLLDMCDRHLEHVEPRVRALVAQTLGSLARAGYEEDGQGVKDKDCTGLAVYCHFRERLLGAISTNFERTGDTITNALSGKDDVAVDDTSGWKALETSILALKEFVDVLGRQFIDGGHLSDDTVRYIVAGATIHINRHVREASFQIIRSILVACGPLSGVEGSSHGPALGSTFAASIALGLQDNWSQVRYAASVANRALLKALSPEDREQYYPRLLPRMCLNRYYLADGVKLFSQETWQILMGDNGRNKVGQYARDVADYYCWASNADNHCVREAACHSIAEMAVKVSPEFMKPHVGQLLEALLICFFDESWPVRDAACVASGRFAGAYPEECRPSLDKLYERWFHHVSDPIWSVRDDSAIALGSVCKAYGEEATKRVSDWIGVNLPKARSQEAESAEQHFRKQNDAKAHTGNQVFSCGSLAPKLKKGGCSDCQVTRPSMPWEYSDGAIYLVRELCDVDPDKAVTFFDELAYVVGLTHFVQADSLRETLWKQLPIMAHSLGKKVFKRHLEVFLPALFRTLQSPTTSQLASHAASSCTRELSTFVGPSIFRGRLSSHQQEVMDANVNVGPELPLFPRETMPPGSHAAMTGMAPWATGAVKSVPLP